jgi:hypothetical protein
MVNAAATLQAALNDILRSPVPCSAADIRPPSIYKPLPGRPRSLSLPSIVDLPVELPGSILQENQGFPSNVVPESPATGRPVSQNIRRSTHPALNDLEDEEDFSALLSQFPEPLVHAKSVPNFGNSGDEMRSSRSGNALNSSTVSKPSPLRIQHKKSLSETNPRRRSRSDHMASPLSTDASMSGPVGNTNYSARTRVGTCKTLQPSPFILEEQGRDDGLRERRRIEVSTVCF